jgi:hypothetical protein
MALVEPKKLKSVPAVQSTEEFVDDNTQQQLSDLKELSLDELKERYVAIDQQSQFFKGLILLEARERLPSNNEFGEWIKSVQALCLDNQPTLTRYMNFARYFKDKDRTGIPLTVAYEISAPVNKKVADAAYKYAKGKNLKVSDIKKKISELKTKSGIKSPSSNKKQADSFVLTDDLKVFQATILDDIKSLSDSDAIGVLKSCIKVIQDNPKQQTGVQESEITQTA